MQTVQNRQRCPEEAVSPAFPLLEICAPIAAWNRESARGVQLQSWDDLHQRLGARTAVRISIAIGFLSLSSSLGCSPRSHRVRLGCIASGMPCLSCKCLRQILRACLPLYTLSQCGHLKSVDSDEAGPAGLSV